MKRPVFFFEGVDPAPAEGKRSDHGALVISAATPRIVPEIDPTGQRPMVLPTNPGDWFFDPVYARVITHKQKASVRQWSGMIHDHHQRFTLEKICMDAGSGGGGVLIARGLMEKRQLINGIERDVTPISTQDAENRPAVGFFILHLFKRGDPGIDRVWPHVAEAGKSLAGDELLKDALYSGFNDALTATEIGLPVDEATLPDWRRRENGQPPIIEGWPEERVWALNCLAAAAKQLVGITVATNEDGTHVFSKRGARFFSSTGRDDIAWAVMLSWAAFMIWLKTGNHSNRPPEDESGFLGW